MTQAMGGVTAPFTMTVRVYWEDTDAGGVVYHAAYVRFLERARSDWLRSLGIGQSQLSRESDQLFAVRWMELDFLRPARLDDELEVGVRVERCRPASIMFEQWIRRGGQALVAARVRVASLSAGTFRPQALREELLALIQAPE